MSYDLEMRTSDSACRAVSSRGVSLTDWLPDGPAVLDAVDTLPLSAFVCFPRDVKVPKLPRQDLTRRSNRDSATIYQIWR